MRIDTHLDRVHGVTATILLLCFAAVAQAQIVQVSFDAEVESGFGAPGSNPCPENFLNDDDQVGIDEFLAVLTQWGQSGVAADTDCSGSVGITDFLAVLTNWGPCP